jgi:hypothetical protein
MLGPTSIASTGAVAFVVTDDVGADDETDSASHQKLPPYLGVASQVEFESKS